MGHLPLLSQKGPLALINSPQYPHIAQQFGSGSMWGVKKISWKASWSRDWRRSLQALMKNSFLQPLHLDISLPPKRGMHNWKVKAKASSSRLGEEAEGLGCVDSCILAAAWLWSIFHESSTALYYRYQSGTGTTVNYYPSLYAFTGESLWSGQERRKHNLGAIWLYLAHRLPSTRHAT